MFAALQLVEEACLLCPSTSVRYTRGCISAAVCLQPQPMPPGAVWQPGMKPAKLHFLWPCGRAPAGAFLFVAQPFRLGDRVSIALTAVNSTPGSLALPPGPRGGAVGSSNGRYPRGPGPQGDSGSDSRAVQGPQGLELGDEGDEVPPGWFEGVCEKQDLRYTVLRWACGRRRPGSGGKGLVGKPCTWRFIKDQGHRCHGGAPRPQVTCLRLPRPAG